MWQEKYGNLVEDLENGYTFGNNKYPKTQQKAYEYAMNYKKYKPKMNNINNSSNTRDGLVFAMASRGGWVRRGSGHRGWGTSNVYQCYGDHCYGNCDINTDVEDAIYVHTPDGWVNKFIWSKNGLYFHDTENRKICHLWVAN